MFGFLPVFFSRSASFFLRRGRLVVVRDHRLHVRGDLHRVGGQWVGDFSACKRASSADAISRGRAAGRRCAPGSRFGRCRRRPGHAAQPGERRSRAHPLEEVASCEFHVFSPVQIGRYAVLPGRSAYWGPATRCTSVAWQIQLLRRVLRRNSIVCDFGAELTVRHQAVVDVLRRLVVGAGALGDIDLHRVDRAVEVVVAHLVVVRDRCGQVAPDVQRLVE